MQRFVQRLLVVPAIVGGAGRGLERERLGRDEVAAPDFSRIHGERPRHGVHGALDEERRLRSSRTPVGPGGRTVGEDADDLGKHVGDPVRPAAHQSGVGRHGGAEQLRISTDIGQHPHPQAGDGPVAGGGRVYVDDLGPPVRRGHEVLAARLHPLHRPAQGDRQRPQERFLAVDVQLAAEPTPDLGRNDAHLVFGQAHHLGHRRLDDVRDLGGRPQRQFAALVVRDHASCFHRRRHQALLDQTQGYGLLGGREHLVHWTSEGHAETGVGP